MGKEKQAGFCVFDNLRDIQLMQEFRDYYGEAFQGKPDIEQAHQNLPELFALDIQEEDACRWLPWSSSKLFGYLPKKISPAMLQVKHFVDATEAYSDSTRYEISKNLISAGMRYVEAIEENALRRRTWYPFTRIHRPDYYFIVVISERIKALWKTEVSHALFQEYHCLGEFLDSLTRIAAHYFSALPLQKSQAFHYYLNSSCWSIKELKANVLFNLDKRAISEWLEKIANGLVSYQYELAIYLAYCISDAKLGDNLSRDQFKDGKQLPSNFTQSPIYQNLRGILYQHPFSGIKKITVKDRGISELLLALNKSNSTTASTILEAYNQLLSALHLIFPLIANLRFLAKNAQSEGEDKMAHDKTLSLILKTNQKLISGFLKQCQDKITTINTHNPESLKGHEYFILGPQKNMQQAIRNSKVLQSIAAKIEEKQQRIQDKIRKIKKETTETLAVKRNELLVKTEQLLTVAKKNAIIPRAESENLLGALQRRFPRGNSLTDSSPSVVYTRSEGGTNNINHQEDSVQITTPQFEEQAKTTQGDLTPANPFPSICTLLGNDANAKSRFDQSIQRLHNEIDTVLPEFICQLRFIHTLRQQLDNQWGAFCQIEQPLQKANFLKKIKRSFSELRNLIRKTQYAGTGFNNFSELDDSIIIRYNQKETQWYAEIETLLSNFIEEDPNDNSPLSFLAQQMIPVKNHMLERIQAVIASIDALKSDITQAGFQLDLDIIPHYSKLIIEQEEKLTGLKKAATETGTASTTTHQEQPLSLHGDQTAEIAGPAFNKNAPPGSLEELENICILLFTANASFESLKASLLLFYSHLRYANYELYYFGGETLEDGSNDKFPHHIAEMLKYHQKEIDNISDKSAAETFRNHLFGLSKKAIENNSSLTFFGYRLFDLRHESTQLRYQKMHNQLPR